MGAKKYAYLITVMTSLLLAACGTSGQARENAEISSYDWQTKGFVLGDSGAGGTHGSSDLSEGMPLFPVSYEPAEYVRPENITSSITSYATDGSNIFAFSTFITERNSEVSRSYAVQRVDQEGNIQDSTAIAPDMWGLADGRIEAMDILDPEQYVFWAASDIKEDADGNLCAGHFYAIYTDADGKEQQRTDLIDFLKGQNIWKRRGDAVSYMGSEISCDSLGNIYLCDWEGRAMYLLSPEGELLDSYTYQASVDHFIYSMRADSGEEILVCQSDSGMEFIWLDMENRQAKQLTVAEKFDDVQKWFGLQGNTLYYATRSQIIGWNISTGEKQALIDLAENELQDAYGAFFLKTATGGRFLVTERSKRYLLTFSTEKPEIQGKFQVANLVQKNDFLKGRVVTFSRENPLLGIEYVEAYGESNVARVLMEMANGKGPAIAFVSREDMENLQSKGALADLNEILWEETLEELVPGVIELGTYDGSLYGLPLKIDSIDTVCIASTYFQGDTWTIGDVMTVLEEHPELEGLFSNGPANYGQNMIVLLATDLEHSPFIENGKARFDSKEFQELLETVKARGNAEEIVSGSYSEEYDLLRAGKILGTRELMLYTMQRFCDIKALRGDDCYYVGFPTETGKGNYLVAENGVLVVNQNAAEKEEVRLLLNYLFSMESQQKVSNISVRLDVPETLVMYDYLGRPAIQDFNRSGSWSFLDEYDDSYLNEYLDLLKSAVPRPVGSDKLFDIIWEESEAYFYSDKSVEAVCDAIQRRIQLYLDEQ